MKTFASLFSGGGLTDVGAVAAGYEPIWGVEIESAIAEVYRTNLGNHIINRSILDVDPMKLERPDTLWASPPCVNFSVAKTNGEETEMDIAIAQRVVDFLKVLTPPVFILENVEQYKRSKSLRFIEGALYALGYWCDRQVLNSADFSVPQTRKRLILRSVRGGFPAPLPPAQKWVGWYEAIADLIPDLPESQFADWQLQRMPSELAATCLVHSGQTIRQATIRDEHEPSPTVTAEWMRRPVSTPKAFIVDGKNIHPGDRITIRDASEPHFSVVSSLFDRPCHVPKAFIVDGQNARTAEKGGLNHRDGQTPVFAISGSPAPRRAWTESGRVVSMTPRALARFQTLSDRYLLPDSNKLACTVIGNGVPCRLAQTILESTAPLPHLPRTVVPLCGLPTQEAHHERTFPATAQPAD